MVLIMDREGGCEEIVYERWTSRSDATANIALVGMAHEDIGGDPQAEKQIQLAISFVAEWLLQGIKGRKIRLGAETPEPEPVPTSIL